MNSTSSTSPAVRNPMAARVVHMLSFAASLALLVAVSIEIIGGDHTRFSRWYMTVQLVVCLVFLLDFFVRWAASDRRGGFVWHNLLFLLLSIPYLNIVNGLGVELTREWAMGLGTIPLMRTFLAMYVIVSWLIDGRERQLFIAYIFTVAVFTFLSALIFYDYEAGVNDRLHGFGNALWWAWMGVTTVGAAIFPVTAVGKTLAVLLPILGMMMFPIFTLYVTSVYAKKD